LFCEWMSIVGISLALDHLKVVADADAAAIAARDSNANLNFIKHLSVRFEVNAYYAQSCWIAQRGFPGVGLIGVGLILGSAR
jgi:hypothetical protein